MGLETGPLDTLGVFSASRQCTSPPSRSVVANSCSRLPDQTLFVCLHWMGTTRGCQGMFIQMVVGWLEVWRYSGVPNIKKTPLHAMPCTESWCLLVAGSSPQRMSLSGCSPFDSHAHIMIHARLETHSISVPGRKFCATPQTTPMYSHMAVPWSV